MQEKNTLWCYSVGYTPGPIGRPVIYHPTTIKIQAAEIIRKYGVIILKDFLIVIGLVLFRLYIFK